MNTLEVCHQYTRKLETLHEDFMSGEYHPFEIDDLEFFHIEDTDVYGCLDIKEFIERYEWLGKMPVWVTHRFGAYIRTPETLVGATVMGTPYRFSNLLGEEYKDVEKLIARGATISYAPKNLGSWITMKSIRWMVKNTEFRIFTAYADPMAGELGTIYQACNFYYLGQTYGGGYVYVEKGTGKQVSSSYFSQRSVVKKASVLAGVNWKPEYIKFNKTGSKRIINYDVMSPELIAEVKKAVNAYKKKFDKVKVAPKHKYAYILGETTSETRRLRERFEKLNPELVGLSYPKERGK